MKIFSYNVNGIRAAIKKGFLSWLEEYSPDVICLQEIKANKDQLDLEESLQTEAGETDDFTEGVNAFIQKRPAVFKGR